MVLLRPRSSSCKRENNVCLLALFFRVFDDAAVVLGANREEAYARGGEPPQLLRIGARTVVAGRDPVASGTWLGVNDRGLAVAVTNRPKSNTPSPSRSRGLLALDLLASATATAAAQQAATELGRAIYGGCNLLCVDADNAYVVHAGDWLRVRPLPAGLHVLTARDVNDDSDPRLAFARDWLGSRAFADSGASVTGLRELCAMRGNGAPAMCLRGEKGGTVSSTILALGRLLGKSTCLHAQGPPDTTPFVDYSSLLHQLGASRPGKG
jgi:hypothetical protein